MKVISFFLLLIPLVYIFIYKKFWNKKILESVVFGLIFFMGVNSLYFFITSIFHLSFSILSIFIFNLLYCLLMYFLGKKNKKETNNINHELTIVVTAILIITLFIFNVKSFNSGFRIPIPSLTEDAAAHFNYVLSYLSNSKFEVGFYPLAFHGNAWIFVKLAVQLTEINNDMVFITNIYSLYIWLILFLTISLISIIIYDLTGGKNKSKFLQIIISILSILFGSMVSLYFIKFGFFSNWLNQLFSLGMVYLLFYDKSKSIILSIPLLFGFFFSYSFFAPVLCIFYTYLYFFKKKKEYLNLCLISIVLFIIFLTEVLQSSIGVNYLITASGGFPGYPTLTLILYVVFVGFYLVKNNKNKSEMSEYLSIMGLVFLFYSFGLAILQYSISGGLLYSFHKVFASSLLFFGMFAVTGFIGFLKVIFSKKTKNNLTLFFVKTMFFVILLMTISFNFIYQINPPLGDIIRGYGNFFSNSSEKYNGVVYALENFSNFKNVIYIDGDYQSTRWATSSYLLTKYNVIYDLKSVMNFKNYDYYISQLKKMDSNTLIVNPIKVLEFDCESEGLIKIATESAKVYIYPPFDLDLFRRNCSVTLNKNKNE